MGGNALKHSITRRYQKQEFEVIIPDILSKVRSKFTDAECTKYYRDKLSFGDADILVLIDNPINFDIEEWISLEFDATEIVKNSSVYSFDYKQLQVDLILIPLSNWETSKVYYSYNDINNLIGKIFHSFGLKWGHQGLTYPYKVNDRLIGEIELSKDHRKSLLFLGLDPDKFDDGFDNIRQMMDYVTSSPYFDKNKFLRSKSATSRKREAKRDLYQQFIEYISDDQIQTNYQFAKDKTFYLNKIDNSFEGFLDQYKQLEIKYQIKQKVSKLFNGNLLMKYFRLQGSELGKYIGDFKKHFDDFDDYILQTNDIETIMIKFSEINNLKKYV